MSVSAGVPVPSTHINGTLDTKDACAAIKLQSEYCSGSCQLLLTPPAD